MEIKQCISGGEMKITKKMLHQLSTFVEYDTHLNRMMNKKDYQNHIDPVKTENYKKVIIELMGKFKGQVVGHLDKIKQNKNIIYKL